MLYPLAFGGTGGVAGRAVERLLGATYATPEELRAHDDLRARDQRRW